MAPRPKNRFKLEVLCLICMFVASSDAYTPVVYPSLVENLGFVYHEESGKVMSVPGGLDPLLCRTRTEETRFEQADKPCSDVVVFTASDELTLQILNLSANGVIQPFQSIPDLVTTLPRGSIELKAYGSSGRIPVDSIERTLEPPADELESPAEEPGGAFDENLEEIAEGSMVAETDERSDEVEESDSMDELFRDLPPSVDSSGVDAIESSVLTANASTGFLFPNGTVDPEQAFVLEVRFDDLPENTMLRVNVVFDGGVRRQVFVFRDSSPTTSEIRLLSQVRGTSSSEIVEFRYEVEFSDYVFNTPNHELIECEDVREPLQKFSSNYLNGKRPLVANDLTSMITATRELRGCSADVNAFVPEAIVHVTGVAASVVGTRERFSLSTLQRGTPVRPTVQIAFSVTLDRRTRLEINVRSSAGVDLAGQPIEGTSERYYIERRTEDTQHSVERAQTFGTTSTVLTSSSVATSVGTAVGTSMAASIAGSAACNSAGGAVAGGSVTSAVELLSAGQRIYLVSKMSVPNMPENFQAFGESLSWMMLDMKLPWRDNTQERRLYRSSNVTMPNNMTVAGTDDIVVLRKEWPYERLVVVFAWTILLSVCLIVLHTICIAVFFTFRWSLPDILRFPRMELYLFYWTTPAIAGACASLFTGSQNAAILGVVLLCVFPIPFVLWHVYMLATKFFLKRPEQHSVFFEVDKKHVKHVTKRSFHAIPDEYHDRDESSSSQKPAPKKQHSLFERFLMTPLLGAPYMYGDWKTVEGPANKFVERYGPAFEDYRYIPGLRRNATFELSADSNGVQRGYFKPIGSQDRVHIGSVVQVSGTVLKLTRIVFVACFILGQDDPKSDEQALALLFISLMYLFFLRVFRPHTQRWKLAMAMSDEVLNILTLCIILYLLKNDAAQKQEVRRRLGTAMLFFEGTGFFLIFIEQLVLSLVLIKVVATGIWLGMRRKPRILQVIAKAQLHNPRYLERKYFRRWVTKTLGRGIYPGVVKRDKNVPFEERVWADPSAAMCAYLLPSCCSGREPSTHRSVA